MHTASASYDFNMQAHVHAQHCSQQQVLLHSTLTSKSTGRGLPGCARMGPTCVHGNCHILQEVRSEGAASEFCNLIPLTILKSGVTGRSHSAAQSVGARVITSRCRSSGALLSMPYVLLQTVHMLVS
jgi:hypothetical protein